eukprot:9502957-Pyramimonas_sp.AAC.1
MPQLHHTRCARQPTRPNAVVTARPTAAAPCTGRLHFDYYRCRRPCCTPCCTPSAVPPRGQTPLPFCTPWHDTAKR